MRRFVMGDIHGEYERLIACLQDVKFDYEHDMLIQLGDVVDRGAKSYEVVEELMKIKNLVAIKGNHDDCFYESMSTGNNILFNQGGKETLESYIKHCNPDKGINLKMNGYITDFDLFDYPHTHVEFFKNQLPYYVDENNWCFVHGGFNRHKLIEDQEEFILLWDRDLLYAARSYELMSDKDKEAYPFKNKNNFERIFVGHTPTQYFGNISTPFKVANVHNLDTGCGKGGILTIMNLENFEYYQN